MRTSTFFYFLGMLPLGFRSVDRTLALLRDNRATKGDYRAQSSLLFHFSGTRSSRGVKRTSCSVKTDEKNRSAGRQGTISFHRQENGARKLRFEAVIPCINPELHEAGPKTVLWHGRAKAKATKSIAIYKWNYRMKRFCPDTPSGLVTQYGKKSQQCRNRFARTS